MPGFFNVYRDDANGRLYMEIDKWDTEILYTVSLPAGLGSKILLDRGLNDGGIIIGSAGWKEGSNDRAHL
jgi:hypothetical protein